MRRAWETPVGLRPPSISHAVHRTIRPLSGSVYLSLGSSDLLSPDTKHARKRRYAGRGVVGKTAVVGMKDRHTNRVSAAVVPSTDRSTLQQFVVQRVGPGATVYSDDARAYDRLPFEHETVKHSVGEYVNAMAHTNGIESFWSLLKRGYHGTYHHMSRKHLPSYVPEFAGRHNHRAAATVQPLECLTEGMLGKRLKYRDLVE